VKDGSQAPGLAGDLASPASAEPILELRHIRKAYESTVALDDVSLSIAAGSVHAIMGENGAGKTTLIEIIAGNVAPDDGEILFNGSTVRFRSAMDARRAGVAVVHQHLSLAPNLSVAENIFAMRLPASLGMVSHGRLNSEAQRLLDEYGVPVSAKTLTGTLSTGVQQQIEILRALSDNAKVVLLDEPTSSLSVAESDHLFAQITQLQNAGAAVIIVTHRIRDVFRVAQIGTVLRDGRKTGTFAVNEVDSDHIVRLMIGRSLDAVFPKRADEAGNDPPRVTLRVRNVTSHPAVRDVSLTVSSGEIVGLYGLVGAGRSEFGQTLFGLRTRSGGEIEVAGTQLRSNHTPQDAMKNGLAFLPEDRTEDGLFSDRNVSENICAARLSDYGVALLSTRRMRAIAKRYIERLRIKGEDDSEVRTLSGGNQQKVLFARWLVTHPQVFIVDEPTRGVDIATKARLHHELRTLADSGQAVLMISSDLPEVLGMSDRVYVMAGGRITDECRVGDATEERLLISASGRALEN
jgi:ABC-type sugar transport system ATPase subunit